MAVIALALERSVLTPYIYAVAGVGGVLAGCFILIQLTGNQRGFGSLFWLWMVASGVLWGRGPAYAAALLGTLVMYLYFFPPGDMVGLATFLISMLVAAYITGLAHTPLRTSVPVARTHGFWSHQASGDYGADCTSGEREADAFLLRLRTARKFFMLGWMVRDMIARGTYTGLEAGFFHRISKACNENAGFPGVSLLSEHDPDGFDLQPGVVEPDSEVGPPPVGH
jgi:hypothetical protein